jgi:hypothetical protein
MKSVISLQLGSNHQKLMQRRNDATTQVRTHGTKRLPAPPRSIVAQAGQGGALLTWHLPTRYEDVTGYRIYVGTEKNLSIQIRDRGTRQIFVPLAGGTTPPLNNVFVSVVNGFREGPRRQIQIAALSDSAPQVIPSPPNTFLDQFSGGLDKTQGGQPTGKKTP